MSEDYKLVITPSNNGYAAAAGIVSNPDASPLAFHQPKPDGVMAVKLTKDNLQRVAHYAKKAAQAAEVTITDQGFSLGKQPADFLTPQFVIGEWIVEEYDFVLEKSIFGVAGVTTRQKYNLR